MITISEKKDIRSMLLPELEEFLSSLGQPRFRAGQIFSWLHRFAVTDFEQMTDQPKALRAELAERCYIADAVPVRKLESRLDETVKYLYRLYDGETVESVLMKYEHGYTVCISTQVGCRMGCKFCASGLAGLRRNLTASEMLAQITAAERDRNIRVSNVVMMGMGEPLDNFDNSVRFLKLVSDDNGQNIGLRHISLSTSGIVPKIKELAEYRFPITLSVSLHAPNNELRKKIMPVAKAYSLNELLDACRIYQKATTRRISFEYALMSGVNDTDECAEQLAFAMRGIMCHINLIPANPVKENDFEKPDRNKILHFRKQLEARGLNATVRRTLGADIEASCGQLRSKHEGGRLNAELWQD